MLYYKIFTYYKNNRKDAWKTRKDKKHRKQKEKLVEVNSIVTNSECI